MVVWSALNDLTFFEKVIQQKPSQADYLPADFSPSQLALLALDQNGLPGISAQNLPDTIDEQLIPLAMRNLGDQPSIHPSTQDLASAGLAALTFLNQYQRSSSWHGLFKSLLEHPNHAWWTPLACLFGFLDDPSGLLHALVQPGATSFQVKLAVHAILSNSLPPTEQVEVLMDCCRGPYGKLLPPSTRLLVLRALFGQRPNTAIDFALRQLDLPPEYSDSMADRTHVVGQVDRLLEDIFQLEIREIAGKSSEFSKLLKDEISAGQNLYSDAIIHSIYHLSSLPAEPAPGSHNAEVYGQDIDLATQHLSEVVPLPELAKLALALAHQGRLEEANQLLPSPDKPLPEDGTLLFAMASVSFLAGNLQQSQSIADKLIDLMHHGLQANSLEVFGDGLSLVNLGKLLLELHKPMEACLLFEYALQTSPNDAGILQLLAQAYMISHQDRIATEILNILVSLFPADLDYRRAFAGSLEALGDWEASLTERSIILKAASENSQQPPLSDKYHVAHCALNANKPESVIQICDEILSEDNAESQALIYSGRAYLLMGQVEKGMELLARATQTSPTCPEAWLNLANAQEKIYPHKTVIETLRAALQLIPDSSQIHFVLGDLFLQDNELNLALPELKSAVELSPDDPQMLVCYGKGLRSLGQNEQSREILSRAFRLEPDFPGLAYIYSQLLVELGKLEEAIAPLETLISPNTTADLSAYLDYARCILTLNSRGSTSRSPMKALIALNEVLQLDPQHAEAKALTAEALAANGENELAFQAYREALDTSLTEDKVWFERLSYGFGCVARTIGKNEVAVAALQEAAQTNPNNPAIFEALSDAYSSADLPEDALKAARNVLVINGDNPDRLVWFANQVAKICHESNLEIFNAPSGISKELASEALAALTKAIQLAPARTDLLVQLGNFQSKIGDHGEARVTFASIAALDFASIEDLVKASSYLSEIRDHSAAISCLEKAISIDKNNDKEHDPELYGSLAQEYVNNHDHASAINILDKAIESIPDHTGLISQKVAILLGLGQPLAALDVVESALRQNHGDKPDIDLLFLASRINRFTGSFSQALSYAKKAVDGLDKNGDESELASLPTQYRVQIAEMYRALLQPQHAFHILQQEPSSTQSDIDNEGDFLDFIFLHTELALETGERLNPDIQNVKLDPSQPGYIRFMALNARLMNKAGNYNQAELIFQDALQKLNNDVEALTPPGWSSSYYRYLDILAMIEAAQDIGAWDHAITWARQEVESAPGEPISHLNLAKNLVLRAEFNRLCQTFDVSTHTPSEDSQSRETYAFCKQYLDQARARLDEYHCQTIDNYEPVLDQIYRWQARADIIFGQTDEPNFNLIDVLAHLATPGDVVAVIRYLQLAELNDPDNDALTHIVKLARSHPRNPAVFLQLALALQRNSPLDALKSLQSVLEQNPYTKSPTTAFCNIMFARLGLSLEQFDLAKYAVENAISFWSDEPAWHWLAAQVYQQIGDLKNATRHLAEAADLDPKNISYRLDLGKLLFDSADENTNVLTQALQSFEMVLDLDPHNLSAITYLASTNYLLNDLDKAEAQARVGIAIEPTRADLYQLLSKIAIAKNDYQGAYEFADKAIQLDPKDTHSTVMLARSLSAMGRSDEALAKLNAIIPLVQDARLLHLERVNIIKKVSGPQIALNELKTLITAYPGDFNLLNALSKSFYEVGKLENAVAVAQQALGSQTEKASAKEQANLHLLIGQVLRQSGQLDQSIQHLEDALQLAPSRLEPYLELGLARKERREYQQALQIFERATAIAPNDPRAPFQAGLALKESKDYKLSETMLRRAVSLAPNDITIRRQLAAVVALNLIHNPRSTRVSTK